ncbi:MAG: DUF6886 family protein [Streptosporangiaceae bacterium]
MAAAIRSWQGSPPSPIPSPRRGALRRRLGWRRRSGTRWSVPPAPPPRCRRRCRCVGRDWSATWHAAARIELRITPSIWPFWRRVANSTVEFSGSRLGNSAPHPDRFG